MAIKTWSTPVSQEAAIPIPCALCGGNDFVPHFTCTEENPGNAGAASSGEKSGVFNYVRCVRCTLVQINPQPDPAAIALRYGEAHGDEYLAYEKANEASFLQLQELALQDAGFFEAETFPVPGTVLDVGCATGALLALLKERGWKTRGIEISKPQAAYCRSKGLDVSTLPLEENGFADSSFDAVLASHLIEHLNNPESFVREAGRILKPGGRFYVSTPNISGFQARLFGSRWRSAIFDHLYLFSVKTLSALLEGAGFSVERVRTWGGLAAGTAPGVVKKIADRAAKRFGFGDVMILRAIRL
jgi:SAM-dependent methyltransferase